MTTWIAVLIISILGLSSPLIVILYGTITKKDCASVGMASFIVSIISFFAFVVSISQIELCNKSEYVCYDILEIKEINTENKVVKFTVLEDGVVVTYEKGFKEIILGDETRLEYKKESGSFETQQILQIKEE